MFHRIYKLDNVCTLIESGSTGKYQHSVCGVPLSCALENSLDLMLVFPCTPLVKVQTQYYNVLNCTVLHFRADHYILLHSITCALLGDHYSVLVISE